MLGWLRHKATPVPQDRSAARDGEQHGAGARLGKLLDRLGNESHTAATIVPAIASIPIAEAASETAVETAPSAAATERKQEYLAGVDPDDYREAVPLLRRAMAAVGGKAEDDSRVLVAKIVGALRERHGFTADLVSDIGPYLEQFVRDVNDGIVQLDADDRVSADAPAADKSSPDTAAAAPPPASESIMPDAPAPEEAREIPPPAKARRRTGKGRSGEGATVGKATPGPPKMRVIAVCSQKGGAGKTTIAAHLAVGAGETGHGPAVLIDTDPQGSLDEWRRARHSDSPALAKVKPEELAAILAELRSRGAALAIIDTPPALTGLIEQVIALADLVVIPARPGPLDLRAVGVTVEMARRAGKPFLLVVNGATPRAGITAQAVATLSEHGQVAPVVLCQRTDFAASMTDGRTVIETAPEGNSAREIAALWQCVYEQIGMRAAA